MAFVKGIPMPRLGWIALLVVVALALLMFGWNVWPTPPPEDLRDAREAGPDSEPESETPPDTEEDGEDPAEPKRREFVVVGRVVDPDGEPVPGAEVIVGVLTVHGGAHKIATGKSGPEGGFSLKSPPVVLFRVSASKSGLGSAIVPWIDPGRREEIDLGTLALTRGLSISGSVVDGAGNPVGADVSLDLEADPVPESWEHLKRATQNWTCQETTAKGTFRFVGVPPGLYRLSVDFSMGDDWGTFTKEHVVAGTEDVRVIVPEGTPTQESERIRIRFKVFGPDDLPVPRGQCSVFSGAGSSSGSFRDGGGEKKMEVLYPAWLLVFDPRDEKDRPLPYAPIRVELTGATEEPIEVRLRAGLEVRGEVLADGEPAAVAFDVVASLPGDDVKEEYANTVRFRVKSGEDGALAILGLPPGTITLELGSSQRFVSMPPMTVTVGDLDVTVRLRRSCVLKGAVLIPAGIVKPRVKVIIFEKMAGGRRVIQTTSGASEPKGKLTFVIRTLDPRRRYEVVASVAHSAGTFAPTWVRDIVPGGDPIEIVPEKGLTIRGTVQRSDGTSVGGALIRAVRPGPRGAEARSYLPEFTYFDHSIPIPDPSTVSDGRGRFRLRGLGEGDLLLVATSPGLSSLAGPVRARAGESGLVLVLDPVRTISGRVVDTTSGALEDLQVQAWPETGPPELVVFCFVGRDGFFETSWLGSGRYRLIVRNRWEDSDERVGISPPIQAGSRDVRIQVRDGLTITGTVSDPGGGALRGVRVDLRGPGTARHVLTEDDGAFTFRGLPVGRYGLTASVLGPPAAEVEGEARAGGPPVNLVLPAR
jgi:Carboxypeptidase regulatory-like domain